jgi:hypothetical protein
MPRVALGIFVFANEAMASVRLDSGSLIGRSLLGRISVPVQQISKVVPINLRYRRTLLTPWNCPARSTLL